MSELRRQRRSVTARVIAAGAVGLVLVGVVLAALVVAVDTESRMTGRIEHTGRVLALENTAERGVIDLETVLRGYAATGHRLFLAPFRAARAALPAQLSELDSLVARDPAQERRQRALGRAVSSYITTYADPFAAHRRPLRGRCT
ncbi:MAG: CHASE3 domain-containing protein [Solirubrobacteraceae bacterium]